MSEEFASLSGADPVETWFTEVMVNAELNRPRTTQKAIGPSELGNPCDRALAYRVIEAEPIHYADPLKAQIGTGFHALLGEALSGNPRYLTEHPVHYRGISGSADIFDRWFGRLIDLKTTQMQKIKRMRFKGIPNGHRVQTQTYAAGLDAAGFNVRSVTLLYVPTDGTLADAFAVTAPFDRAVADNAIDRLEEIQNLVADGERPEDFDAHPTPLCAWCSFYRPNVAPDSRGCPGGTSTEADVALTSGATAQATETATEGASA